MDERWKLHLQRNGMAKFGEIACWTDGFVWIAATEVDWGKRKVMLVCVDGELFAGHWLHDTDEHAFDYNDCAKLWPDECKRLARVLAAYCAE